MGWILLASDVSSGFSSWYVESSIIPVYASKEDAAKKVCREFISSKEYNLLSQSIKDSLQNKINAGQHVLAYLQVNNISAFTKYEILELSSKEIVIEDEKSSITYGSSCRICNDYNSYAIPDADGKHTCYSCRMFKP